MSPALMPEMSSAMAWGWQVIESWKSMDEVRIPKDYCIVCEVPEVCGRLLVKALRNNRFCEPSRLRKGF